MKIRKRCSWTWLRNSWPATTPISIIPISRPLADSQLARAIKGKFLFGGSRFPIFLEPGVLDTLTEIAARKGMVVNDLVNDVLKRELATADVLR